MTEREVYTPMRRKRACLPVTAIAWIILASCGTPADSTPMPVDPPSPAAGSTPATDSLQPVPTPENAPEIANLLPPVATPESASVSVDPPAVPAATSAPIPVDSNRQAILSDTGPSFEGESTLKERISNNSIIVRASITSVAGAVDVLRNTAFPFGTHIDFSLRVHEYLKGSGPDNVVAVVWAGDGYDSREGAQAYLPTLLANRNGQQWEDRQAIIFLDDSRDSMPRTEQSGYYFLSSLGHGVYDYYSLSSRSNKKWLPSASPPLGKSGGAGSSELEGDALEFLLAAPGVQGGAVSGGASGASAPTITLSALKELIATVEARMRGSERHKECVRATYKLERRARYKQKPTLSYPTYPIHTLTSGQARGGVIWQDSRGFGYLPDGLKAQLWLDGGDSDLFTVTVGPDRRVDKDGDGTADNVKFDRHVVTTRPLPADVYRFQFNERGAYYVICEGWVFRYEWTVTVTSPPGVLHEAFFDPVTVGTAVKADGTNGVLKPASFTDANSASATLQSLSYEPPAGSGDGTVKLHVDPHTGLVGHSLDFIELDGSVSLSLRVADAAVDAASKTLSWSVASQPWDDGDKLMLRIRKAPPPAPQGLGVSLANGTFTISWSAVTGADQYRVGYRTGGSEGEWTNLAPTTGTSQTYSPEGGVACGTTYEFRVQARGDGTTYAAEWGATSEPASHTTGACNSPPVFGSSSYSFSVAENASVWDSVGIVTATDPDEGDSITYHITAGNEAGRFDISSGGSGGTNPGLGRPGLRDGLVIHADSGGTRREGWRHVVRNGGDHRDGRG